MKKAASVPTGFSKYYEVGSMDRFVESGEATADEVQLMNELIETLLSASGYSFYGWAFAKPKYEAKLLEADLASLIIVKKGRQARQMFNFNQDEFMLVNPEDISAIF